MNTDELFLIFGGHAAVLIDRLEKISATISDDPGEIERASFEHRQLVYETRLKLAELYSGEVKEFTGDLFESLDHAIAAARLDSPDIPAGQAYFRISKIFYTACTSYEDASKLEFAMNARDRLLHREYLHPHDDVCPDSR